MLGQLLRRRSKAAPTLEQLSRMESYPILSAQQLIDLLGQTNRIRSIRRLASLDHNAFDQLYQPALNRYIEATQLQPASTVDHHAGLGGLVVHTLEVVELSLRERKQFLLPQNSGPETIAQEEHTWTYGVFAAALLHDAGKLLTLTQLRLDNSKPWTPVGPPLQDTGATHYSIEFISAPYALQTRVSSMLFGLLPAIGRNMLAQNQTVMSQLTAYLNNDPYEWGIIGKISRAADSQSVSRNLSSGATDRLPNVTVRPVVERITRALRALVQEGDIVFNRSGGSAWFDGTHTYLVCKVIAQKVIDRLHQEGSTDIPTDNTRLFDLWQDHGYAIPTPEGKAVWTVTISCNKENYQHTLTVLKFDGYRVIHPSQRIAPFTGSIDASSNRSAESHAASTVLDASPLAVTAPAMLKERQPVQEPVERTPVNQSPSPAPSPAPATQTAPTQVSKKPDTPKTLSPLEMLQQSIEQSAHPEQKDNIGPVPLEHADIGWFFLSWLRQSLADGTLTTNDKKSMVHTLPEGVALVSPKVFHTFIIKNKLIQSEERDDLNSAARRIQNKLRKTRLLLIRVDNYSVIQVTVRTASTESKLNVFMLPTHVVYPDSTPPPPNPIMTLASTLKPN